MYLVSVFFGLYHNCQFVETKSNTKRSKLVWLAWYCTSFIWDNYSSFLIKIILWWWHIESSTVLQKENWNTTKLIEQIIIVNAISLKTLQGVLTYIFNFRDNALSNARKTMFPYQISCPNWSNNDDIDIYCRRDR